jgi:hypothetical protein
LSGVRRSGHSFLVCRSRRTGSGTRHRFVGRLLISSQLETAHPPNPGAVSKPLSRDVTDDQT